jgi:hypothetical protein
MFINTAVTTRSIKAAANLQSLQYLVLGLQPAGASFQCIFLWSIDHQSEDSYKTFNGSSVQKQFSSKQVTRQPNNNSIQFNF